jgi:hypothetical protein
MVSVIFNFFTACFLTMLRGFLGGTGILASRLVGFSTMTGMFGVSSSSSSEVSSMLMVSSPSPTSQRSFDLPFPP